jgi:hypothetical protein
VRFTKPATYAFVGSLDHGCPTLILPNDLFGAKGAANTTALAPVRKDGDLKLFLGFVRLFEPTIRHPADILIICSGVTHAWAAVIQHYYLKNSNYMVYLPVSFVIDKCALLHKVKRIKMQVKLLAVSSTDQRLR